MVFVFFAYDLTKKDIYNVDSTLIESDLASRVMWSLMFVLLWCGCIVIITIRHRTVRRNRKHFVLSCSVFLFAAHAKKSAHFHDAGELSVWLFASVVLFERQIC